MIFKKLVTIYDDIKLSWKISYDFLNFIKLAYIFCLFHLGNKCSVFHSNKIRNLSCKINQNKILLTFRQNGGDVFTIHEMFGIIPYRFPYETLGKINTVVDLGAHIGLATIYFATLFPDAKIISVEPIPDNFNLLKNNCSDNKIKATLIQKCIGSVNRSDKILLHHNSNQNTMCSEIFKDKSYQFLDIEVITLDDLIALYNLDTIDILKVDIEGSEQELFQSCNSWINKVRFVIIEIHPDLVPYDEIISTISSYGFTYRKGNSVGHTYDVFIRNDIACSVKLTSSISLQK